MSAAQIREWDSALTRCAALLVRSSYRDDISDEDADMLRDAVSRATRARDGLITRLRAAESEASSAGVLRCKLTHEEAQTEAAGRALEMVAPGLLAEHGAIFSAVLELGARLRAAEARTAELEALVNWHAALSGQHTVMRPGIAEPLPAAPEAP